MKSVVEDPQSYNWEGDMPPQHPPSQAFIYEMHVAGIHLAIPVPGYRKKSEAPMPV